MVTDAGREHRERERERRAQFVAQVGVVTISGNHWRIFRNSAFGSFFGLRLLLLFFSFSSFSSFFSYLVLLLWQSKRADSDYRAAMQRPPSMPPGLMPGQPQHMHHQQPQQHQPPPQQQQHHQQQHQQHQQGPSVKASGAGAGRQVAPAPQLTDKELVPLVQDLQDVDKRERAMTTLRCAVCCLFLAVLLALLVVDACVPISSTHALSLSLPLFLSHFAGNIQQQAP